MDNQEYNKLCDKESSHILQKIICPYCGCVYGTSESIDIAITENCEDVIYINCKNCDSKLKVYSIVTEYRLFTKGVEE